MVRLTDHAHVTIADYCECNNTQLTMQAIYRISSVIRQSFFFQNNPKDLDPSYKMDLDLLDCLGRVKLVL